MPDAHVGYGLPIGGVPFDGLRACGSRTGKSTAAKADRLPHEAGLRLRKAPVAPRVVPASALIRNHHGVQDWEHFLG